MYKNKTRFTILGLLSINKMSGYDIKKAVNEFLPYIWNESYGQIYKELKILLAEDFVIKERVPQENKPDKNVYTITEKGMEILRSYLENSKSNKILIRNELMLKFLFGFNLSFEQNIKKLADMKNKNDVILTKFYAQKKGCSNKKLAKKLFYPRLLAELVVEILKTQNLWAEKAMETLRSYED